MAMRKQADGISRKARGDVKFDEHGRKLKPAEWDIMFNKEVIGQTIREPGRKWRAVSVKPGAPFPPLFGDWSAAITWLLETWNAVDIGIGAFVELDPPGIKAGDITTLPEKPEKPEPVEPEGTPEGESQPGPQEPDAGSESTSQPGPPPDNEEEPETLGHKEADDSLFASKTGELTKADVALEADVVAISDSDAGAAEEQRPHDLEEEAVAADVFADDDTFEMEIRATDRAADDPFAPDYDPFA